MKRPFRVYRGASASGMRRMKWEVPLATRFEQKRKAKAMEQNSPDAETEMLARMWIECDPNREKNADELMPEKTYSGSVGADGGSTQEHDNPLGGKPKWHWFIPRANATKEFLRAQGYELRKL